MPVQDNSDATSEQLPVEQEVEVEGQAAEEVSSQSQPPKEEKMFTREDVFAILADFEEKKVKPLIQSQVAKSENRTGQRIQERFAALDQNRAALNLTDAQVTEAKDKIIREEQMKEYEPESPQGSETPAPQPSPDDVNTFLLGQMDQVFAQYQVRVTPDMPEYKIIEKAWNDPNGSLASTLLATGEAAQKASIRLSALKGNAKARVTGGGGENSDSSNISAINDTATLYEMGEKRLRERRK